MSSFRRLHSTLLCVEYLSQLNWAMVGYSALVLIEIPLPNIQNKANYKSCSNSLLAECVIHTNQKKKKKKKIHLWPISGF